MIIDAHHHLWEYNGEDYRWIDNSMGVLSKDHLPDHLMEEMPFAGVTETVAIQARQKPEETRWLLELAEDYEYIRGVVGWVDLRSEKVDEQLDEFAVNPKLVGVRHVIQDEVDDDFMLLPEFTRGIEKLGPSNLTYDLLLFPRHLNRAVKLANMFPEQKFVLDHIGKPNIMDGILDPWRKDIQALAAAPNVWCKISGMVTEADKKNWKYEDFIPYLDVVGEAFGTDRIMLGSDWPVCKLAGDYRDIMNIPLNYFKELDGSCRQKIFRTNCIDFYDLTIP